MEILIFLFITLSFASSILYWDRMGKNRIYLAVLALMIFILSYMAAFYTFAKIETEELLKRQYDVRKVLSSSYSGIHYEVLTTSNVIKNLKLKYVEVE